MYIGSLLLLAPALLINLGLLTFIDDEGIRSLVALEMDLSGNYIVPTLHGDFYYNKPPLFNWILLVFFKLAGVYNEWVARLPTVLALLGYGATVFYFFQKHYSKRIAFLAAFLLITCGRVLFWDAMLALIDITFSWVMFTLFMVIFHQFERERWWALFLITYVLTAVGFLLKGLPALVFQATTLLVYFTYRRSFRKLVSVPHTAGILVLALLVGSYYFAYHQYNDLSVVFQTLFSESTKRTVVQYGWLETVIHLFAFPFEMTYHFLPWSIMVLYLIRPDILRLIRADRFQEFLLLTFLANIIVYWTSPEVYPRYLLMLAPLIFGVYLYLHAQHRREGSWAFRLIDRLFMLACGAGGLLALLPFALERAQVVPLWWLKSLSLVLAFGLLFVAYLKWSGDRLLVLVVVLLVFRIGFDWFVLPDRNANDPAAMARESSRRVGASYRGKPLFVYGETLMQPTNSFYLTQGRGSIIPREMDTFKAGAHYIVDPEAYPGLNYQPVDSFFVRFGRRYFYVAEARE